MKGAVGKMNEGRYSSTHLKSRYEAAAVDSENTDERDLKSESNLDPEGRDGLELKVDLEVVRHRLDRLSSIRTSGEWESGDELEYRVNCTRERSLLRQLKDAMSC